MLSRKRLRQLLRYSPSSGKWRWLVHRQWVRAGARAGHIKAGQFITRLDGSLYFKKDGRRRIVIEGRSYFSSRLAWLYMTGKWPTFEIDHKNRIRDDDRWRNLRPATGSQNCGNKPVYANNRSRRKGVSITNERGTNMRFMARIMKDGKSFYLGCFGTAKEASAAYARKSKQIFGAYAKD